MAYSYINSARNSNRSITSISVNKPTNTSDNDIMIACLMNTGNVSTTPPSGWTQLHDTWFSGSSRRMYICYKIASSEGASYNFSFDDSNNCLAVITTIRGVSSLNTVNTSSVNVVSTNNGDFVASSITTTIADCIGVFFGMHATTTSFTSTAPSGYTEHYDNFYSDGSFGGGICVSSKIISSAGSTGTVTATMDAGAVGSNKAGILIALKQPTTANTTNFFQFIT